MNINTGEIYRTKEELEAALKEFRVKPDEYVQGSEKAIEDLKKRLFPKQRRLRK